MKPIFFLFVMVVAFGVNAQQEKLRAIIQSDAQWYLRDKVLDPSGEYFPDERLLGQGFALFTYTDGDFQAGIRYENYQNVMLGFPTGYQGEGITYRYARIRRDNWDITVGNFYEQFGSGLIFRSYEERGLGLDNAMDGVRIITKLGQGLKLKGVIGRQRKYFSKGEGIVRGIDLNWSTNEALPFLGKKGIIASLGGSFVSKFQRNFDPILNLPNNVGAFALRSTLNFKGFNWTNEWAHKINDPSYDNGYIYKPGQAILSTLTFSKKGLGILASIKRIDNMSFRSDRNGQQFDLFINFLPPTSKPHTYALAALYPYATQINGEVGGQFEVNYMIPRGSFLGGKYGTRLSLNSAISNSIDKSPLDDDSRGLKGTQGYVSDIFKLGPILYFSDINGSISHKFSKKLKSKFTYFSLKYNKTVLNDGVGDITLLENLGMDSIININAFVWENQFKLMNGQTLRSEIQWALADGFRGDMAMGLVEWTINQKWTLAVQDIYNYGHPTTSRQIHYPIVSLIHFNGPTRVQLGYGRQQQGVFCVGGVCRVVPPSNGLSVSITTSL
ncbi:MAG: Uncharacterised protein [Owenweeksia sp. TMED14]|nr:MAG: Uncharacterised protein [Owenweeksia sp. TMED14]